MKLTLQIVFTILMVISFFGSVAEKKMPDKIFYFVATMIIAAGIVAVAKLL